MNRVKAIDLNAKTEEWNIQLAGDLNSIMKASDDCNIHIAGRITKLNEDMIYAISKKKLSIEEANRINEMAREATFDSLTRCIMKNR